MKRNISDLEMGGESEINLSPMIDCIFILLIFFIIGFFHFSRYHK